MCSDAAADAGQRSLVGVSHSPSLESFHLVSVGQLIASHDSSRGLGLLTVDNGV